MEVVRACHTLRRTSLPRCRSTSKTGAIVRCKLRARIRMSLLVAQLRVPGPALVLLLELRWGEVGRCRQARVYHISRHMLPLHRRRTSKIQAKIECRRRAHKCKPRPQALALLLARALASLRELRRGEEGRSQAVRDHHISEHTLPLRRRRTDKPRAQGRRQAHKCKSRTVPRVLVPARALEHEVRYRYCSPRKLALDHRIPQSIFWRCRCDSSSPQGKRECNRLPGTKYRLGLVAPALVPVRALRHEV